jgi:sugar/nucleoside kinase (ribokinase family)
MPDPAGASGRVDWRIILARTLPQVDLFLPSVEELLFMLRRERFEHLTAQVGAANVLGALTTDEIVSLASEALAMGAKIVLLKMGTRGAYLQTSATLHDLGRGAPADRVAWADQQLWAPCYKPDAVVSTVGTGDAAVAGFLAAMLRGTPPALALKAAVATGACCVEKAGALSGVRSWEETMARIESDWTQLPLEPGSPGWTWDRNTAVWRGPTNREDDNARSSLDRHG